MAEPRQRLRSKNQQQFSEDELRPFLTAFGDDLNPLPETVKVLDEILTDYIIEVCHEAGQCAAYSHRQKIKVDDFKFALRKDPPKLGRMVELLQTQKEFKDARRVGEIDEGALAKQQQKKDAEADKAAGRGKKRKAEARD